MAENDKTSRLACRVEAGLSRVRRACSVNHDLGSAPRGQLHKHLKVLRWTGRARTQLLGQDASFGERVYTDRAFHAPKACQLEVDLPKEA